MLYTNFLNTPRFLGSMVVSERMNTLFDFGLKKDGVEKFVDYIESFNYDETWKTFTLENLEYLGEYFTPKYLRRQLDFTKAKALQQEFSGLYKLEGKPGDQLKVDQILEIPFKRNPKKVFRSHFEFQGRGTIFFTRRTAKHMHLINWEHKTIAATIAIIHRANKNFKNRHSIGTSQSSITYKFKAFVVSDQPESYFSNKPGCLISQIMYAVWLSEHRSEFTLAELNSKLKQIFVNINALNIGKKRQFSALLFVLRNASKCFSSKEKMINFVRENSELIQKQEIMTMFERYANEKVKEANVKNAKETAIKVKEAKVAAAKEARMVAAKETAIKIKEARLSGEKAAKERVVDGFIRRLLDSKQFSLNKISELTGVSIKRVKAVKAV